MKSNCAVCDKIYINYINDPYSNYSGRQGYITHIDDMGQLHGTWGGLALVPGEDSYQITQQYTPLYYSTPCQVRWYNPSTKKFYGGIAYLDKLIKGDGSVFKTDDIVLNAVKSGLNPDDAVIELDWIDISEAIWTSERKEN